MKRIEYKTWPGLFEAVLSGRKKFDMRLANRKCQEGDILVLKEWDPKTREYTGRVIEKKVTYVLKFKPGDFWNKNEFENFGVQVMSLE